MNSMVAMNLQQASNIHGTTSRARKPSGDFRTSLEKLVRFLEQHSGEVIDLDKLSNQFGIQRRRLSDVVTILASMGYCTTSERLHITQLGLPNVKKWYKVHKTEKNFRDESKDLQSFFDGDCTVTLNWLTVAFIDIFGILESQQIDLHAAAAFLSRNVKNFKTVLCKLYIISMVLEIVGFLEKESGRHVVRLTKEANDVLDLNKSPIKTLSIDFLTSRYSECVEKRRRAYIEAASQSSSITHCNFNFT